MEYLMSERTPATCWGWDDRRIAIAHDRTAMRHCGRVEEVGNQAHAVRLLATDGDAAKRRNAGETKAGCTGSV